MVCAKNSVASWTKPQDRKRTHAEVRAAVAKVEELFDSGCATREEALCKVQITSALFYKHRSMIIAETSAPTRILSGSNGCTEILSALVTLNGAVEDLRKFGLNIQLTF